MISLKGLDNRPAYAKFDDRTTSASTHTGLVRKVARGLLKLLSFPEPTGLLPEHQYLLISPSPFC